MLRGLFGKRVTVRINDDKGNVFNDMYKQKLFYGDMKYYTNLIEMDFLKFKAIVYDEINDVYIIELKEGELPITSKEELLK